MVVVVSWPANSSVTAWSRTTRGRERRPGVVGRGEQQPEHAAPGIAPAPALLDLRAHERVEPPASGDRARAAACAGSGSSWSSTGSPWIASDASNASASGSLPAVGGVEPEQAAQRDPQRQLAHPVVDLDHLPVLERARPPRTASSIMVSATPATYSRWNAGSISIRKSRW